MAAAMACAVELADDRASRSLNRFVLVEDSTTPSVEFLFHMATSLIDGMISKGRSRRQYEPSFRDRVKLAKSHEEVAAIVREATKAGVGGDSMRKLEVAASLRHLSLNNIPAVTEQPAGYEPPLTTQFVAGHLKDLS